MPIIDFRYRPSTPESLHSIASHPVYAEYIRRTDFLKRPAQSLEACIEELERLGVARAVITGRDCESTYAAPNTNGALAGYMRAAPKLFVGFYGYDPHKGMAGLRAFRDAVERQGMRGASIDPPMAHCPADAAGYYPLYAACCDYGIPVTVTGGLSPFMPGVTLEHGHPLHIDRVATDFPELRLLMSHGGYPFAGEALAVALRHPNVYLDLSSCEGKPFGGVYLEAAATCLRDKVVFASAHPFADVGRAVAAWKARELPPGVREKILCANGLRLLGEAPEA